MYEAIMLANTLISLVMLVLFMRRPGSSLYHPFAFYLAFHFLVFVIRPPLVYFRDYDFIYTAYQFTPDMAEKSMALIVASVGLVAFGLSSMCVGKSPMTFSSTATGQDGRERLLVPLIVASLILAPIGFYSLYISWQSDIIGISSVVTDRSTGIGVHTQSNGYIYESRLMLGPLGAAFAYIFRFRWWSLLPLAFFVLIASGTGTRGPFILAMVGVLLLMLYQNRVRWPNWRLLAALCVILPVFAAVGADRGAAIRQLFVTENATHAAYGQDMRLLEGMDAGNLEYLEYLVYAVPNRTGTYGYFIDNLQLFTEPIPRALWKDKPVGAPIQLFSLFDYGYPIGMTKSVPGTGYVGFGLPGVILWCALFGSFWGLVYERFVTGRQNPIRVLSFMLFLPLSILAFRDGGLLTIARFGVFLAFPVFLMWAISRLMRTGAGPAPVQESVQSSAMTPALRRRALAAQIRKTEE